MAMNPMNKQRGVSLIETVIYVAILATITILVVNTILAIFTAYSQARLIRRVVLDAETALERMTREIRLASSIDNTLSSLGSNPSHLVLNTVVSFDNPSVATKEFYLTGSRLVLRSSFGPEEFLISDNTRASSFVVYKIETANSQALKINLTLDAGHGEKQISHNFYQTAILRGSY